MGCAGLRRNECKGTAMCKWKRKKNGQRICKLKKEALWEKQAQSVHDDEEGEVEKPDDEEPEEEEEGEEEGEGENGDPCAGLRRNECKGTAMCKWKRKKNGL